MVLLLGTLMVIIIIAYLISASKIEKEADIRFLKTCAASIVVVIVCFAMYAEAEIISTTIYFKTSEPEKYVNIVDKKDSLYTIKCISTKNSTWYTYLGTYNKYYLVLQ